MPSASLTDRHAIMGFKTLLKNVVEATGYTVRRVTDDRHIYSQDGLRSEHLHEFMNDPAFIRAYNRGVSAAGDYRWHWRVHIGLWAASSASRLEGDFVECGVNRGFLSSAIMEYLDWDSLGKTFYLLDTFAGIEPTLLTQDDIDAGAIERNRQHLEMGFYVTGVEGVCKNFSQWKNVRIVQGPVPDTLRDVHAGKIAYLHLDMNCAGPEVAAFNLLWDRLVPGAFVLMDDYAFLGAESQKAAMDAAAGAKHAQIASLPTGQGLLIKT
jgi:hypothetical protein